MITGAHVLLYSEKAELDRAFFKDVLGFPHVDVGHGWLIFALPPAEVAVHPADGEGSGTENSGAGNSAAQNSGQQNSGQQASEKQDAAHRQLNAVLYLMCDDLAAEVAGLKGKGASCTEIKEERWGIVTNVRLPSGGELGLYQPKHEVAYGMKMG